MPKAFTNVKVCPLCKRKFNSGRGAGTHMLWCLKKPETEILRESLKNKPVWNKGKTKKECPQLKGNITKNRVIWNKGLKGSVPGFSSNPIIEKERKRKISDARKKHFIEIKGTEKHKRWKEKISKTLTGHISKIKGKKYEEIYSIEKSAQIKQKISNFNVGKKISIEVRKKLSENSMGAKNHFYGKKHTNIVKNKIREARLKQRFPTKDTNIEKKVQGVLTFNSIAFQKQKSLLDKFQVDIFIEPNIVIECDGEYWHSRNGMKEKDRKRDKLLTENGYIVKRFKEKEILKSIVWVQEQIMEVLDERKYLG